MMPSDPGHSAELPKASSSEGEGGAHIAVSTATVIARHAATHRAPQLTAWGRENARVRSMCAPTGASSSTVSHRKITKEAVSRNTARKSRASTETFTSREDEDDDDVRSTCASNQSAAASVVSASANVLGSVRLA